LENFTRAPDAFSVQFAEMLREDFLPLHNFFNETIFSPRRCLGFRQTRAAIVLWRAVFVGV
jgi:hypothetical protein